MKKITINDPNLMWRTALVLVDKDGEMVAAKDSILYMTVGSNFIPTFMKETLEKSLNKKLFTETVQIVNKFHSNV